MRVDVVVGFAEDTGCSQAGGRAEDVGGGASAAELAGGIGRRRCEGKGTVVPVVG